MLFSETACAGPVEDFYSLEDQMVEAQEAYLEALKAAKDKDGGRPGGHAKLPPDGRLDILKRMDALAAARAGKPDGLPAAVGAFMWSWNLDLDLDRLLVRFDALVKHYSSAPELDDVLSGVAEAGATTGKPDDWVKSLNRLIIATTRDRTRIAALFTLGRIHMQTRRLTEAKVSFEKVVKSGGKSDYTDLAKGYIYEIDHLQVGMVAPDFVARTLDGKTVPLKSLRGKAVLLNFWATW